MGCRVVLSSCQECNSHAAGIPFHSIPLAASLLWPGTGAASRGGGGLLFHLATFRSLLDPSASRGTERARSESRNRGSCSRWFRLNAAFRTASFVSKRLLILSWILVPLREPARSRGEWWSARPRRVDVDSHRLVQHSRPFLRFFRFCSRTNRDENLCRVMNSVHEERTSRLKQQADSLT